MHRRAFIARLATAAAAATALTFAPAEAQQKAAPNGLAAVKVDTGPIAAKGRPAFADKITTTATTAARAVFAGSITGRRGAPTLVLRLSSLILSTNSGIVGTGGVIFGPIDDAEGDAILIDGAGREIMRRHIISKTPPPSDRPLAGAALDDRRLAHAVTMFAQNAKAELGL